jgi:LysR family transcriptional regulator, regulator of peptidoglycan recycling
MHGPSLAEMNAFVAVLERRSFTKAAKQLGLSTARVSEMVRNLEERLYQESWGLTDVGPLAHSD